MNKTVALVNSMKKKYFSPRARTVIFISQARGEEPFSISAGDSARSNLSGFALGPGWAARVGCTPDRSPEETGLWTLPFRSQHDWTSVSTPLTTRPPLKAQSSNLVLLEKAGGGWTERVMGDRRCCPSGPPPAGVPTAPTRARPKHPRPS